MKLLNKSFKPFSWFTLFVMLVSIPLFYFTSQYIYIQDTSESLLIARTKLEDRINMLTESEYTTEEILLLLNQLDVGYALKKLKPGDKIPADSIYTISRFDEYHGHVEPFRVLESVIWIRNTPYWLKIEMDMDEYHDVIPYTALLAGLFFLLIVLGYILINRRISGEVWRPFLTMLDDLEKHTITSGSWMPKMDSDIEEFEKLSQILKGFIERNRLIFQKQKEFTENASHELQTPLALLQSKVDVLFQTEGLTEEQSNLLDEIKQIGSRMNKVNSNLLLLVKIENKQFDKGETFSLQESVHFVIKSFQEWAKAKNIEIRYESVHQIKVSGNKILTETAIQNLVKNAIHYNTDPGTIDIRLDASSLVITNTSFIPELDKSKVFNRFYKFKAGQMSSGLGLAILKEICEFHGWRPDYSYNEDQHCFTIHF
ncbi:MAG: HAMP domain-containing histidine kinase [Cyclobacteriaceae bacterium]|nr:HAMP domain-containing histidine kinase [Cyclobacteriaceae bacterium]